jgi:hypothetical protein
LSTLIEIIHFLVGAVLGLIIIVVIVLLVFYWMKQKGATRGYTLINPVLDQI